jgi:hypothetical protein
MMDITAKLKRFSSKIPTKLSEKIALGEMKVNKPYFTYGLTQFCDYLLFIKDDKDELYHFYVWENMNKTIRFAEGEFCKIIYMNFSIRCAKEFQSDAVFGLFAETRTLEEMGIILKDFDLMCSTHFLNRGTL